ncbi:hypothetical protein N9D31_00905 [Oligoflexaceae bacterium]|nr:hypothetical protein [Oligoflexaceae bacterium]
MINLKRFQMKILVASVAAIICYQGQANEIVPQTSVRVYSGEGHMVKVLELKEPKDHVLIEYAGTNSYLDGRVMLHMRHQIGKDQYQYSIDLGTKKVFPIATSKGWWWSNDRRIVFFRPGKNEKLTLSFNESKSEKASASQMLKKYRYERTPGVVNNLAWKKGLSKLSKICGAQLSGEIAEATFPKELQSSRDITGVCSDSLKGMTKICEDSDGKVAVKEKIQKISCTYIKTGPSFTLTAKTLTIGLGPSTERRDLQLDSYLWENL